MSYVAIAKTIAVEVDACVRNMACLAPLHVENVMVQAVPIHRNQISLMTMVMTNLMGVASRVISATLTY